MKNSIFKTIVFMFSCVLGQASQSIILDLTDATTISKNDKVWAVDVSAIGNAIDVDMTLEQVVKPFAEDPTDNQWFNVVNWAVALNGDVEPVWANITSTPTTLAGYGITDAATFAQGALADTALQSIDLTDVYNWTGEHTFGSGIETTQDISLVGSNITFGADKNTIIEESADDVLDFYFGVVDARIRMTDDGFIIIDDFGGPAFSTSNSAGTITSTLEFNTSQDINMYTNAGVFFGFDENTGFWESANDVISFKFNDVTLLNLTATSAANLDALGGNDGSSLTDLNGSEITSGTVAEARIDAAIARDSEVTAAIAVESASRLSADNRRAYAGGVAFAPSNSFADLGNIFNQDMETDWAFSLMVRSRGSSSVQYIIGNGGVAPLWYLRFDVDGKLRFALADGTVSPQIISTQSFDEGDWHHVVVAVDVDSPTGMKLFVDGVEVASGDPTSVGDLTNAAKLYIGNRVAAIGGLLGDLRDVALFNRALSTTEVEELSEIGLGAWLATYPEDKWGGAEGTLTSGTLTVGKRYRINTFETGDDFTNVGAASNATGVEFVATGTTPTTWTNSSELEDIGALAAYPMNEGIGRQLRDLSGRYDALLSATGYQHLQPKTEGFVRVAGIDADPAIYMLAASNIIPTDSVITDIIAEERVVAVANTAQDLADNRIRLNPSGSNLQIQRSDGTNHTTLGTVTSPTSLDDIDAQIHYKQIIR